MSRKAIKQQINANDATRDDIIARLRAQALSDDGISDEQMSGYQAERTAALDEREMLEQRLAALMDAVQQAQQQAPAEQAPTPRQASPDVGPTLENARRLESFNAPQTPLPGSVLDAPRHALEAPAIDPMELLVGLGGGAAIGKGIASLMGRGAARNAPSGGLNVMRREPEIRDVFPDAPNAFGGAARPTLARPSIGGPEYRNVGMSREALPAPTLPAPTPQGMLGGAPRNALSGPRRPPEQMSLFDDLPIPPPRAAGTTREQLRGELGDALSATGNIRERGVLNQLGRDIEGYGDLTGIPRSIIDKQLQNAYTRYLAQSKRKGGLKQLQPRQQPQARQMEMSLPEAGRKARPQTVLTDPWGQVYMQGGRHPELFL